MDRYAGAAKREVTLDTIAQVSLGSSDLDEATDKDEPETLPQGLDSSSTSPLQETLLSTLQYLQLGKWLESPQRCSLIQDQQ